MSTLKSYVLDSYTHIGDRVICQIDPEMRAWSEKGRFKPDGTEGVIIGYHRYKTFVERNRGYNLQPGEYKGNGAPIVKWDDGTFEHMSSHHICPKDQNILDQRKQDKAYREAFDTKQYIGPLPVTEYYEGDRVFLSDENLLNYNSEPNVFIIVNIDYHRLTEFCNDGITPYPCYQVQTVDNSRGLMSVNAKGIVGLHSRGNYWRMEHNEPLEFEGIEDKLHFYSSIGECVQQVCPVTGNYVWPMEEIVKAIEDKTIAFCKLSPALFGATPRLNAYTIPNYPEVEEEARQHFIKMNAQRI